jgi:hypothetical protein
MKRRGKNISNGSRVSVVVGSRSLRFLLAWPAARLLVCGACVQIISQPRRLLLVRSFARSFEFRRELPSFDDGTSFVNQRQQQQQQQHSYFNN